MTGFFSTMGARLRNAARATAFSVMGVVFGLAGLGFLTVALWILLAAHEGVLMAYTVIGALYLVLGFCLMALGAQGGGAEEPRRAAPPSEPTKDPLVQLAEGFAMGMQAGRAMRERRD
ncbi:Putative Holin-X, holin superfamily III [Roseovarius tolerans]|jgi:hypothetical protein|uniref:Putative Holin-X, holin superfamily III n=1 Tax=Roseovarius tolerans TaxID=74031 RepID=A0A1H7YQG1_9RHOB|nr:phage holin family protein [Roseovarius tolerans]SEM48193.1 Putative Holin-X, holin superfamily III [Roseovarius tolerans]